MKNWLYPTVGIFSLCVAAALCLPAQSFAAESSANAMQLINTEQYSEAKAKLEQTLEKDSSDAAANAVLAKLYVIKREPKRALGYAKTATKMVPKNADYWMILAVAYQRHLEHLSMFKKLAAAQNELKAVKTAVRLNPKDGEARLWLAQYYRKAPAVAGGSASEAEKQLGILRKVDPARAQLFMASEAVSKKNNKLALKHYKKAFEMDATPLGGFNYGVFLMSLKRYKDAMKMFADGMKNHPNYSPNYYEFAMSALLGKANTNEGIKAMQNFLSMPHSNWKNPLPYKWAHYRLGMLYGAVGNKKAEAAQYEQALKRDPHFKQAEQALKKLQQSKRSG